MGIPSYFSNVIKEYPHIIKKLKERNMQIDHFFLDSNSIIYDCARQDLNMDGIDTMDDLHELIIDAFLKKIEEYISVVRPKKTIMISLDGTPPVAKLEQQRQRRYKSWATSKVAETASRAFHGEAAQQEHPPRFNTIEITTGTKFMKKINTRLEEHFSSAADYGVKRLIVSHADDAGEGESKIYEFLRNESVVKKQDKCLVYGLDADLIMLSLNNLVHCSHIYLFRETPEFIKSIDSSLEPNAHYVLDIPVLSTSINFYMNNGSKHAIDRTQDYIFLCFMLGNDFLPHFPAVNIRTDGIDKLMNAYKHHFANTRDRIIENNAITWKHFRKIVAHLAQREEEYFVAEIQKRNKFKHRQYPMKDMEQIMRKFEELPTQHRNEELFMHPAKHDSWKKHYYNVLFDIETADAMRTKQISTNYLEGIEWTFKYYTIGCPDWRWHYRYDYPPLLGDLIKHIPYFDTTYVKETPMNPVCQPTQLCYVLPKSQLGLLPTEFTEKLLQTHANWYDDDAKFRWAFCKYFWESHAQLPEIPLADLDYFVNKHKALLCS